MYIEMILFENMMEIRGDENLSSLLKVCSLMGWWKELFPTKVSSGWHWSSGNQQVHYLKKEAAADLADFLCRIPIDLLIRTALPSDSIPLDEFEEWDAPANQEAAITLGYLDAPKDYQFIKSYYHLNAFGAWRTHSPVI